MKKKHLIFILSAFFSSVSCTMSAQLIVANASGHDLEIFFPSGKASLKDGESKEIDSRVRKLEVRIDFVQGARTVSVWLDKKVDIAGRKASVSITAGDLGLAAAKRAMVAMPVSGKPEPGDSYAGPGDTVRIFLPALAPAHVKK